MQESSPTVSCASFSLFVFPTASSLLHRHLFPVNLTRDTPCLVFIHSFSIAGHPKVASWRDDKDCCSWEGVACDNSIGYVVGLNLTFAGLQGYMNSSSPLFSLRHLRDLSLQGNDFLGSAIPPEIGVLTRLEYLDLSYSNISGILPTEISQLSKLFYIDLSNNFGLEFQDQTMRMFVRNLTQMEELYLSSVDMFKVTLTSFMNISSSLISLNLSSCSLGGKLPEFIFQLPKLQVIDLSRNNYLIGSLPESKWSPNLDFLSLRACSFTGVPNSIGNLSRLTYLDLSDNDFAGEFDLGIFSTLENLYFLDLSGLSVWGEDSNYEFSFPQIQIVSMRQCNLSKFPSFLSRSKVLRSLVFSENNIQEIPNWLWSIGIDTLEELYLDNNIIKGGFHLLPWKRLAKLSLISNSFEGPLPIVPSPYIQEFQVSNNRFSGSIPLSMCHLTSIFILDLSHNNFTGLIPQCLGNLTDLQGLYLSNNSLSGPLPPSLANCTSLKVLDVSYNSISGAPSTWLSTASLFKLYLQANKFVGQWPSHIFLRSPSLGSIDLSDNTFEGPLPVPYATISGYSVSNNHFSGEISSLLCNATNLQLLDLSNNRFTGTLPSCLRNISFSLNYLNLRSNDFRGPIPEIFQVGSGLTSVDLSRNQFVGSLPRSLSNCKILEALNVGSNKIADSFPNWLGDLPLRVLSLKSNNFHGHVSISGDTRTFSELRILDLSDNCFEGNLSDEFISEMVGMTRDDNYDLFGQYMGGSEYDSVAIYLKGIETEMTKINVQFVMLDLSSNRFQGKIPRSIGLLKSLKDLNFSHNSFTGTIPPSIGNLTNLEGLDFSSNHLFGEIPKELVKLTFLGFLNLSQNNLTGPIPLGGHFNTFRNSSFEGNLGLCGIPLTRSCGQGPKEAQPPLKGKDNGEKEGGGWLEWKNVALGFGSGMGMGISLGYIVLEVGRPLWLVRMVIRLEASCKTRSKRKGTPRRNV